MKQIDLQAWRDWHLKLNPDIGPHLDWVAQRLNRCESDLERLFLMMFAFQTGASSPFTFAGELAPGGKAGSGRYDFDLAQQVSIAGYRCDFVFTVRAKANDKTRRIAIECDGHSFHDRTREQASYDRRRDRKLLAAGVPTLRYTYSDITGDPTGTMADLRQTMLALAAEIGGVESE